MRQAHRRRRAERDRHVGEGLPCGGRPRVHPTVGRPRQESGPGQADGQAAAESAGPFHGDRRRAAARSSSPRRATRRRRAASGDGHAARARDPTPQRASQHRSAHSPVKRGGRLSKNAAMPSARSAVVESRRFRSDSSRSPSASVRSTPALHRVARRLLRAGRTQRRAAPRVSAPSAPGSATQTASPLAFEHGRVDGVADDQHAQRQRRPTGSAGQALGAAPARQLACSHLREGHRRVGTDDAEVGREQELGAGPDRRTVPHRHGRSRERRPAARRDPADPVGVATRGSPGTYTRRAPAARAARGGSAVSSSSSASNRAQAGPRTSASGPAARSIVATSLMRDLRLRRRRPCRSRRPRTAPPR